jgi:ribosomal protein S18 acetylase RimI-like enzyme
VGRQVRPFFFGIIRRLMLAPATLSPYFLENTDSRGGGDAMIIGHFTIQDYDDLLALWDKSGLPYDKDDRDSREKIERQLFDDHIFILTMKTDEGRLIGSVIGSSDGRKGWINRLAIDPDYRGHRLGQRLLEKCEELLRESGVEIFAALIEDANFPSMALFRRSGYEGWDKIVYFRKKLK